MELLSIMTCNNSSPSVSQVIGIFLIAVIESCAARSIAQEFNVTFECHVEDENGKLCPLNDAIVWMPYGSIFNRDRLSEFEKVKNAQNNEGVTDLKENRFNTLLKEGNLMSPKALFIQTNECLFIRNNSDSLFSPNIPSFNNNVSASIPAGRVISYRLVNPDHVPVIIRDDLEDVGTSVLLIQPHPFGSISAENGMAVISEVPAGEWEFTAFHQQFGAPIKVLAADGTVVEVMRKYFKLQLGSIDNTFRLIWKKAPVLQEKTMSGESSKD
jgi:hypothetical protein